MAIRLPRNDDPTINLTPMIDVVFLLIIFFMVGAKFSQSEGRIPVNVPGVDRLQSLIRGPDRWVVEVSKDGKIFLDGQETTLTQLGIDLKRAATSYPDLGVVVRGDGAGTLDTYARVLSLCSSAGVAHLDVAVRKLH